MKSNNCKLTRIALLAGLMTASTHGATLFTISGLNASTGNYTIGCTFTVGANDLVVASLGVQDFGDNGLDASHQVGIWGASATALASVTVASGTGVALVDHYRYVALTGPTLTLTAGGTYFIGAQMNGDSYSDGNLTNVSDVSAVSGYDSKYSGAGVFAKPTTDSGGTSNLRWGPANMQFTVVPEPSAALLGGLGMLCLLRRRRN